MDANDAIATNRRSWDQRVAIHLRSASYQQDVEKLRRGGLTLAPPTDTEIGDVSQRRIAHLQCHIGTDTLSLARLGAEVVGLDFSSESIEAARKLACDLGISAQFIVGDAQHADQFMDNQAFDMVFASFGVFCWIPDVEQWIRSAGNLLKPGGVLYVADGHPIMDTMEHAPDSPQGIEIRYSYFREQAIALGPGPTYADDGSGQCVGETVEFIHPVSRFIGAAIGAGLDIDFLHEFPGCFFQRYPNMVEGPAGLWDFPGPLAGRLPMVFSMRAVKRPGRAPGTSSK